MAISAALLKWYQSATWAEGDSHGGAVDTGEEIADATAENIFDHVSNDERVAGDTEYRKIFFRNENADAYNGVRGWIHANTPATNDAVSILAGGSKSKQGADSDALSGTFTFAASTTVLCTSDISKECRPGEKIFNSTDDTNAAAKAIASISADGLTITLAEAYAGTTGDTKAAKLAPISGCTFVSPTTSGHADALVLGSLAQNESIGIWIKRVVDAAGDGYTDNTFTLKVTNTA
ncbi:MAG: hypothetical protein WC713_11310 [Candidatus Methylomirabilota bacterium]